MSDSKQSSIGIFDPLLGQINARAGHPHFVGGYKIWPGSAEVARAKYRIMTIGNSTSMWPAYPWSLALGKQLKAAGHSVAIFNGAGKGHSSSQEVLRVVRDAPGIRPNLIVALSGICDVGYLVNAKNHPFLHKYNRDLIEIVQSTGYASAVNYGYPDPSSPAEIWCRNQRLARLLAAELGAEYLTILQPVMGIGLYTRSPEEEALYQQKAKVILKSYDKPYAEALKAFYDEVFERIAAEPERYPHVVSLVDVFADAQNVWKDHRHPTEPGCEILASAVMKTILGRFKLPLADAAGAPEPDAAPVAEETPDLEPDALVSQEDDELATPTETAPPPVVAAPPRPAPWSPAQPRCSRCGSF